MSKVITRKVKATSAAPADTAARLKRIEAIGPTLWDEAHESDRQRMLTEKAMAALHGERLFRMLLPRDVGGDELPLPEFFQVIEALGRFDGSTAWCVCQGNGCATLAAYLDLEVAQTIWGKPDSVLAWGPGRTEARAGEGGYRIFGKTAFMSGSHRATWLAAHCNSTLEADGTLRKDAKGGPEVRTAVFPADSVTLSDTWDVVGLRGTGSDGIALDGLFVPDEFTIVRSAMMDRRRSDSPIYGFPQTGIYALGFAGVALGIARGFLDAFLALAQEKKPRLVAEPIRENPVVQDEVAHAEARIGAARAYLVNAVERAWREAEAQGEPSVEARMGIRLAGTHATHEAKAAVDLLYDTAGTSAVFASTPFERRFRDVHAVALQIQGRKTHYRSVGAWLLGHPPDMEVI